MIFTFDSEGGNLKNYAMLHIHADSSFDNTTPVLITFEDSSYIIKPVYLRTISGVVGGDYKADIKVQSTGKYTITCGNYSPVEVIVDSIHGTVYDVHITYVYVPMISEMTSATTPYGKVSGNVYSGSQAPYKAFTSNVADKVLLGFNYNFVQYFVQYDFEKPIIMKGLTMLFTKASGLNMGVMTVSVTYSDNKEVQNFEIGIDSGVIVNLDFYRELMRPIESVRVSIKTGLTGDHTGYLQNVQVLGREVPL